MRMRLAAIALAFGLVVMVACSGGSGSPTSPTSAASSPLHDPPVTCPAQGWQSVAEGSVSGPSDYTMLPLASAATGFEVVVINQSSCCVEPVTVSANGTVVASGSIPVGQSFTYVFPTIPAVGTALHIEAHGYAYNWNMICTPGTVENP